MDCKQFSFEGLCDYVDVLSILDGDTISISIPIFMQFGKSKHEITGTYKFNIRLFGIDTCELKSKDQDEASLAKRAKARLTELINECDNKIFVKFSKYDKYGRILGEIFKNDPNLDNVNQKSFNDILIIEGLAKSYFGGTK